LIQTGSAGSRDHYASEPAGAGSQCLPLNAALRMGTYRVTRSVTRARYASTASALPDQQPASEERSLLNN